jgi:hypothetical protein
MSFLFWGFATVMLIAAVSFVAIPLKAAKLSSGAPTTLAIFALPIAGFALYFMLGSPGVESAETGAAHKSGEYAKASSSSSGSTRSVATVDNLVDGLRARLDVEPDDAGGWLLLARSYDHLGRNVEAIDAYERARSLGKADVEFESKLLGKSLTEQPVAQPPGPALRGRVELTADAAALIEPGDTVFIFAKESAQHRMPVVALRKPATELPLSFVLTDREAMAPGTSLSQFESLVVTAKISKTGNASESGQGLEVWSDPVSPLDGKEINLIITAASKAGGDSNE